MQHALDLAYKQGSLDGEKRGLTFARRLSSESTQNLLDKKIFELTKQQEHLNEGKLNATK